MEYQEYMKDIYGISKLLAAQISQVIAQQTHCCFLQENIAPNPLAKEELNFLARLLGGLDIQKPAGGESGFRLNLFTTDEEEEYAGILLGLGLGFPVGSPGEQNWPSRALGSEQCVVILLLMSPVMQLFSQCHWTEISPQPF